MMTLGGLVHFVILLIVFGLVFWLLHYLVDTVPMFGPYKQVARVILVVLGVLVLIGLLLNLAGYPIIVV